MPEKADDGVAPGIVTRQSYRVGASRKFCVEDGDANVRCIPIHSLTSPVATFTQPRVPEADVTYLPHFLAAMGVHRHNCRRPFTWVEAVWESAGQGGRQMS